MRKIRYENGNSRDEIKSLSLYKNSLVSLSDISKIIQKVREDGDSALLDYTHLYDGVDFPDGVIQVTDEELEVARNSLTSKVIDALILSAKRIKQFHELQLPQTISLLKNESQEISYVPSPLRKVGLYVLGHPG